MSNNEKAITLEELEKEILNKASEDKDFKKMLFDNPKETLVQFGVKILFFRVSDAVKNGRTILQQLDEDATAENNVTRISFKGGRAFYEWYYKSILNELRDDTTEMTETRQEDVDWHTKANYEFYWH